MTTEKEIAAFWDDFAAEYEAIQQEACADIPQALTAYLLQEKILPAPSFLDLAGGSGKYLPALEPYVTHYTLVDISEKMLAIARIKGQKPTSRFCQMSQANFFKTPLAETYDVVFSAMNPALTTAQDLANFMALGQHRLILRFVASYDTVFSPYEKTTPDTLLSDYQHFLQQKKLPYQTKTFSFTTTEKISRDFFLAYFAKDYSPEQLQKMVQKHFGKQQEVANTTTTSFRLLMF